jgi:hypothetical protein
MTVRFRFALFTLCIVFLGLMAPSVSAQAPPSGAVFDLATSSQLPSTGILSTYTLFNTSFVGDGNTEYVSFAFREVPAFWSIDDTSVTAGADPTNLLGNPGFEQGATTGPADVGTNFPDGWGRWIQPVDLSSIGVVASNSQPGGCTQANSGTQFWCDGSVEGYDGIDQAISTTSGVTYNVSFYLNDNSGNDIATSGDGIDMLVYAGDTLPLGSQPISATPEPPSLVLLGSGLAALGGLVRRKLKA